MKNMTTAAMLGRVHWSMDETTGKLVVGNVQGEEFHYVVSDPEAFWAALAQSKQQYSGYAPLFGHPWLQQWAAERGLGVELDTEHHDAKAKV